MGDFNFLFSFCIFLIVCRAYALSFNKNNIYITRYIYIHYLKNVSFEHFTKGREIHDILSLKSRI